MRQAYLGAEFWSRNIARDSASAANSRGEGPKYVKKLNEIVRILSVSLMSSQ